MHEQSGRCDMKKSRWMAAVVVVLVLALAAAGCSGPWSAAKSAAQTNTVYTETGGNAVYREEAAEMAIPAMEAAEADVGFGANGDEAAEEKSMMSADGGANTAETGRKLVRTGYLRMESTEYDRTVAELQQLFAKHGVTVENSDEYDGGDWYGVSGGKSTRTMTWQLRIPADHFEAFFEETGTISGQIRSRSVSSADKTKQYNDTAVQIESLTIQQENLMEMMKQAKKIEDMLAIEDRLAQVRSELRILSDSNSQIDYDVAWSTISVELQEVHVYQKENITYWERLRQAAGNSLVEFVEALGDFLVTFLYAIPYLAVLGVLVWLGRKVFRSRRQKRLEKKQKKEEARRQEER